MLIPFEKAVNASIAYLSGEVGKVANMRDKFLMYCALGAVQNNPGAIVNAYKPTLHTLGIIDDAGNIETDAVRSALNVAFSNVPKVSAFGFTFSQSDADALLRRLEA